MCKLSTIDLEKMYFIINDALFVGVGKTNCIFLPIHTSFCQNYYFFPIKNYLLRSVETLVAKEDLKLANEILRP